MGGKLDKSCTDPFIISEGLGKRRFQLKTSEVKTLKQTIHYARLKFYHGSNNQSEEPLAPADLSDCQVSFLPINHPSFLLPIFQLPSLLQCKNAF